MPEDLSLVNPHAGAWTYIPTVSKPLPDYLTTNGIQLDGTYLSHYHWDHCGDVSKVPLAYVGAGTKDGLMSRGGALTDTGFRGYQGPSDEGRINKLRELQRGDIVAEGLEGGNDMFGDGSFVIMPMPGVSCAQSSLLRLSCVREKAEADDIALRRTSDCYLPDYAES